MQNSLLPAMLIAFGTTVAMPASACCVQQSVPESMPQMQQHVGKNVMMGIVETINATPSAKIERYAFREPQREKGDSLALLGSHTDQKLSGADQQMQRDADKGVKTRNSGDSGYVADEPRPGASSHPPGQPGIRTGSTAGS